MSASSEMPYFIKPSIALSSEKKEKAFNEVKSNALALIQKNDHLISKMATLNSLIKSNIPYAYWCGFYLMYEGKLVVGPYQGTIGCMDIVLGRGVCGRSAILKKTIIVEDTHKLTEGSDHITCDPNSLSEIVLPIFDEKQELIAVLDIDSTLKGSFDEIDKNALEEIIRLIFG